MNRIGHAAFLLCLFSMLTSQAYADIPYYFLKISCSEDLHFLSMQTFMLWNVCNFHGKHPHGKDCSKLPSLRKQGIYEVEAASKAPSMLPGDCDLGFGKNARVTLGDFRVDERNDQETGRWKLTVNQREIASLPITSDADLRVSVWGFPGRDKETGRKILDSESHERILFPRIDINLCTADDRTSISLPESFSCSFKEISDDPGGFSFPEQSRSYEAGDAGNNKIAKPDQ